MKKIVSILVYFSFVFNLIAQSFERISLPSDERLLCLTSSGDNVFALVYSKGEKNYIQLSLVRYSKDLKRSWIKNIDKTKHNSINSYSSGVMISTPKGEACNYGLYIFDGKILVTQFKRYFGDYTCAYCIFDGNGNSISPSASMLADPGIPWGIRFSSDSSNILVHRLSKGAKRSIECLIYDKSFNEIKTENIVLSYESDFSWIDGEFVFSNDGKIFFTGRVFSEKPKGSLDYDYYRNLISKAHKNILFVYDTGSKQISETALSSKDREVMIFKMSIYETDRVLNLFCFIDQRESYLEARNGCIGMYSMQYSYVTNKITKEATYNFDSEDISEMTGKSEGKVRELYLQSIFTLDNGDICVTAKHYGLVIVPSYSSSGARTTSHVPFEWHFLSFIFSKTLEVKDKFIFLSLPYDVRFAANKVFLIGSTVPDSKNARKNPFDVAEKRYSRKYEANLTYTSFEINKLYRDEISGSGVRSNSFDFKDKILDCLGYLPDGSWVYKLQSDSDDPYSENEYLKIKL